MFNNCNLKITNNIDIHYFHNKYSEPLERALMFPF